MIDARRAGLFSTTTRRCPDAPGSHMLGGALYGPESLRRTPSRQSVSRYGRLASRASALYRCYTIARNAENFADLFQRSPPPRANAQPVLLSATIQRLLSGSSRCSFLIFLIAVASSDAGTTVSLAFTAARLPSEHCLRQPNIWLGFTPCRPATADMDAPGSSIPARWRLFLFGAPTTALGLGKIFDEFRVMTRLTVRHKTIPYFKRVLVAADTWDHSNMDQLLGRRIYSCSARWQL